MMQQLLQVLVRQLHDDDQFSLNAFEPVDGQKKGMADGFDVLDGVQLVLGPLAVAAQAIEVAVNELDGLEDAAGGFAFPNFAEAAGAQEFEETVAGDRLSIGFFFENHG